MSFLDSLLDKVVGASMANNLSLSKVTSTTFAQTGYSLSGIKNSAVLAAKSSVDPTNTASASLSAPLTTMRNYLLSVTSSPSDVASINNAYTSSNAAVNASFNAALPGYNYSLYDIQTAAKQAIGDGITSFGSSATSINPTAASQAISLGNSSLVDTGRFSDALTANSFGAANNSISSSLLGMNNALAAQVTSQNEALINKTQGMGSDGLFKKVDPTDPSDFAAMDVVDPATSTSGSDIFSKSGVFVGTESSIPPEINSTDVVYQEVKLFIEGVQVPFEAISISQQIGGLPSAAIQIPPSSGLMDIIRYYQPKVHIFYVDPNFGGERLLFWGHIVSANYTRSRQAGMATITFNCVHKNHLVNQVSLDYTGYLTNASPDQTDPNPNQATAKINNLNSTMSIIMALSGINAVQADAKDLIDPSNTKLDEADVTFLDKRFMNVKDRYVGMPASLMNFWNQIKKECYLQPSLNTILTSIYIPLMEDGIGFFDRLSGHHFIESQIQDSKIDYCPEKSDPSAVKNPVMVPPTYKLNSVSAIQSSMAVEAISTMLGFSGELTTFADMFNNFFYAVEYELITLASPAEVPADPNTQVNVDDPSSWSDTPKMALETIVKPQLPFYYSPICNVIFPRMFHTISINQQEDQIPTRITVSHDVLSTDNGKLNVNYRSPPSIRESVAIGVDLINSQNAGSNTEPLAVNLVNTTGPSYNVPGKYEQGRGVHHMKLAMPKWLAHMVMERTDQGANDPTDEVWPERGTTDYQRMIDLHAAWIDRYGYDVPGPDNLSGRGPRNTSKDALDPYDSSANVMAYQRLLFSAADYEFTKQVVKARSGTIDGIFNPYIVPGYPMDVLDDSPNHPSFHGLCASVTHTITSRSIGTTIGMVGAMTYAEMSNYYVQPTHPWLQTALNIVNVTRGTTSNSQTTSDNSTAAVSTDTSGVSSDIAADGASSVYGDVGDVTSVKSTLIGNPVAKATADQFYADVFGIPAAGPDDMYYFSTGEVLPIDRVSGQWIPGSTDKSETPNGGNTNKYFTAMGNLKLVSRPIEGRNAIESKFGIKFIDMNTSNYSPTAISYENPVLTNATLLEPGASLFLDYDETSDFIGAAKLEEENKTKNEQAATSSPTPSSSTTT